MLKVTAATAPRWAHRRTPAIVVAVAAVGLLGGGCSSTKGGTSSTSSTTASASRTSMAGMNMGPAPAVNGVKAVPSQVLASSTWQSMKIEARTMTPSTFLEFQGTNPNGSVKLRTVKANKQDSFHLMVMLNDAHTGYPIPYAQVWATISKAGKIVYDEEQWPMLSSYMGPHYGNNVALPGAGHYQLSLLITPPLASRHLEYQGMWMSAHRVNVSFNWTPPK